MKREDYCGDKEESRWSSYLLAVIKQQKREYQNWATSREKHREIFSTESRHFKMGSILICGDCFLLILMGQIFIAPAWYKLRKQA